MFYRNHLCNKIWKKKHGNLCAVLCFYKKTQGRGNMHIYIVVGTNEDEIGKIITEKFRNQQEEITKKWEEATPVWLNRWIQKHNTGKRQKTASKNTASVMADSKWQQIRRVHPKEMCCNTIFSFLTPWPCQDAIGKTYKGTKIKKEEYLRCKIIEYLVLYFYGTFYSY